MAEPATITNPAATPKDTTAQSSQTADATQADKLFDKSSEAAKPAETKASAEPVIEKAADAQKAEPESLSTKDGEAKPKEGDKPVVPEKYDLKLPQDSQLDPKYIEDVSKYAKENGLTNEQAQAIVERDSGLISNFAEFQKTRTLQLNDEWKDQLKTDKDVGGTKFDESGQLAFRAAKEVFGDEFVKLIKDTNLNHQPLLFKGLARLGRMLADDKFTHGQPPTREKSIANTLFDNTKHN